jgi:hypothetical protein
MPMKITPRSEAEAQRESRRKPLPSGWHDARITEAVEKLAAKSGKPMIEVAAIVQDAEGGERTLRDWLNDSPLGAAKLRHACEAVGALARYESGEIGQADFPGHDVRVKLGIEKRRGYPDRNVIEDYAAVAAAPVVNLREVG